MRSAFNSRKEQFKEETQIKEINKRIDSQEDKRVALTCFGVHSHMEGSDTEKDRVKITISFKKPS